jgi:hypothetical protein
MRLIIMALALALGVFVAVHSPDPRCHYHCAVPDLLHLLFR